MINFNEPLKETNLFKSVVDPQVLGDIIPADDSFGLVRHEDQDGFLVYNNDKVDYDVYLFNQNSGTWFLYGPVFGEKSLVIIWPENISRVYFKTIGEVSLGLIGLQGPLIADVDPSDGLTSKPADMSLVQGAIVNQPTFGGGGFGTGPQGPKGEKGDSGIITSGKFKWSNWMGQAPGFQAGNMEYGGVPAYGEATQLTFHKEDADGVDQSEFLDQYLNAKSGQIRTVLDANPSHNNVYQIIGASIDGDGNYVFDVYNVSYDDIAVTTGSTHVYFVLVGAEGPQGPTGPTGPTGATGEDGRGISGASMSENFELQLNFTDGGSTVFPPMSGADGATGPQGPTGPQGATGADGNNAYTDSDVSSWLNGNYDHHIIPSANASYDLGNAEYKIRHLFLSDNSVYIGDKKLGLDATNGLELKDENDNSLWSHQQTLDAVKLNAENSDKLPLFGDIVNGKQTVDPHFGGGLVELDTEHRLFLDPADNTLKVFIAGVLYKIDLIPA